MSASVRRGVGRRHAWVFLLIGLFTTACTIPTFTLEPTPTAPSVGVEFIQSAEIATVALMLDELPVRDTERVHGYERKKFGKGWVDTDKNGCRTRDDILRRDLANVTVKDNDCTVLSGTLEAGPFSGERIVFERGDNTIDIDHLVSLADAWDSGAYTWTEEERIIFANDPRNLLAVSAVQNRSKGSSSIDQWQPPNESFLCTYAILVIDVKNAYNLSVTQNEKVALADALTTC